MLLLRIAATVVHQVNHQVNCTLRQASAAQKAAALQVQAVHQRQRLPQQVPQVGLRILHLRQRLVVRVTQVRPAHQVQVVLSQAALAA